jgi:release factor glutamine methyltransferase
VSQRIDFFVGDLLQPLSGRPDRHPLDVVVSNPPYVPEVEVGGLQPEVRNFEPRVALTAGPDGLEVMRRLLPQAETLLAPEGHLMLEIGMGMEPKVKELLATSGLRWVTTVPDLQGFPRILIAQKER